jgi:hypothetical protein
MYSLRMLLRKYNNKHGPEIQNGGIEHAVELLPRAANRSKEDVDSTPNRDTDSYDVVRTPPPPHPKW